MDCFILSELQDFYPRSPRGERRSTQRANASSLPFLSTLPARGATRDIKVYAGWIRFLSTLPARGATQ